MRPPSEFDHIAVLPGWGREAQSPTLMRLLEERLPWAAEALLAPVRLHQLLRQEFAGRSPLPWPRRLRAWWHGFLSITWILADLDREDPTSRVTDVQSALAARVNGRSRHLLNDKLLFARLLDRFPGTTPRLYAVVKEGRFLPGPRPGCARGLDELAARLAAGPPAIVKPAASSRGHGIYLLEHDGSGFRLDRRPCPRSTLERRLASAGLLLVEERVRQHPYAAALFPDTTNTLRIITMWDPGTDAPFIAVAAQRIGTRASFPVDNVSKGGLWRFVDLDSGRLGPTFGHDRNRGRLVRHVAHPDTGAPLIDGEVPGFALLGERLLAIARALPFLPYVGWDVVITPDGFRILEGNSAPELPCMGPLLGDERVRRFLARHRLLLPWQRGGQRPAATTSTR